MYIGLLSDTHGVFDPAFKEFLQPCDQLWHAGDFGGGLETAKDDYNLRYEYPESRFFECEGTTVLITHIGGHPGRYNYRAPALIEHFKPKIFVCGHSHILRVEYDQHYEMMTLNPGAAGIQGWHTVRTALRFKIEAGEIKDMEVLNVPR